LEFPQVCAPRGDRAVLEQVHCGEQLEADSARANEAKHQRELKMLREQIEEGFDNIAEVGDEIRAILARNWPYLTGLAWLSLDREHGCSRNVRMATLQQYFN